MNGPILKPSVQTLIDRYYPVATDGVRHRDGTRPFYDWILRTIEASNSTVLDVGAGPTPAAGRSLFGRVRRLVGVDVDPIVRTNSRLDEAHVNDGIHLPFDTEVFDAAYSDWTIEHVGQPLDFLKEINRVLKPNASYWFRTTNRNHYVTLVSAHTPHWFHRLTANRVRALPTGEHDPWPVRYRLNTPAEISEIVPQAGFDPPEIRLLESHPSYLAFSAWAFRAGVLYERTVNRFERLSRYRLIILVRATKASVLRRAHS